MARSPFPCSVATNGELGQVLIGIVVVEPANDSQTRFGVIACVVVCVSSIVIDELHRIGGRLSMHPDRRSSALGRIQS